MTSQIVLLLAILGTAIVVLISEKLRPDIAAILVMLSLGVTQLVTPREAFSGLSSPSVILIIAVFILTGSLFRTGVSAVIGRWLVRVAGESEFRMVVIVMLAAAGLSLFMNNIASAAVVMPAVMDASRRTKISPSKLLMPMALATQLAGMATLFTTANIVASGVLQNAGLPGFGLFDFLSVGGSAAVVGILYIAFIGRRSLPDRRPMEEIEKQQKLREDLVSIYRLKERLQAAQVGPGSPLVGQSLAQSGIGDQLGLTVIAIERNGNTLLSPAVQERIRRDDILLVEGRAERAAQLEARGVRISPAIAWDETLTADEIELSEVLVAPRSGVIGKTLKQAQFRTKYGLNVVALWQSDRVYRTDVGDVVLSGGEALLVHGRQAKIELLRTDPDWIVLRVNGTESFRPRKMWVALLILAISLVTAALSSWPVHAVLFVGALVMVLTGCLTMDEAYQAIEWRAVFLVGGMLPVGIALSNTGAATLLGNSLIQVLGGLGPWMVVAGLFFLSAALNQFIPGGSAVPALLVPIAIAAAGRLGADPRAFALVIAIATGTSMLTPFAHPVNVLVMGPGGYRFRDYVRAGLPVVIITFVVVMVTSSILWNIGGR
jgi:di/tricarboxylate transporter